MARVQCTASACAVPRNPPAPEAICNAAQQTRRATEVCRVGMCGSLPVLAAVTDWRWLRSASERRLPAEQATKAAAAAEHEHPPVTAAATPPHAELLNRQHYTPCALQLSGARHGCGGRRRRLRHAPVPRRRRCQRRRRLHPSRPGRCSGAQGVESVSRFLGLKPGLSQQLPAASLSCTCPMAALSAALFHAAYRERHWAALL
jgi:hypothetical protein